MPRGIYVRKLIPIEKRLAKKLMVMPRSQCHVFIGAKGQMGHGMIAIGGYGKEGRRKIMAHRAAWELVNGPIPSDLCVLHKCDNPSCCNVNHLFLGTKADNSADMVSKGRQKKGSELPQAVLTALDILNIRESNLSQSELARRYEVSQPNIWSIIHRKTWTHL